MPREFLYLLLGVFSTWFITLVITRRYYQRSADELKEEAKKLRKLNTLMMRVMEEKGWVKWTRDEKGKIKGSVRELSGTITAKSGVSGRLIKQDDAGE